MRVLAAITLLAGASALVPPPQQLRTGVALRAGFGAATKKSKAKFVKPGKASA